MKEIIKAKFFQKIVLPALLAILLFVISVFTFIIPAFENNAILQKQKMLRELTNAAWSILNKYHQDEYNGLLTLQEAKAKAINEIEALRYGTDKKDYFWITDLQPTMIMHPYVHELTGKSLHDYADPDGKKLFIEAVSIAKKSGEGFIRYKWQFMDDSTNIVPKLSFVKKFSPWGWIIGTGIYIHDVQLEISKLTNRLILLLLAIALIITLIIFFITWQSLKIENKRRSAEQQLRESKDKYKSLLESSTEGIILLLNSAISYTNSFIQLWTEYSNAELLNLPVDSLIHTEKKLNFESIRDETRLEIFLIKKSGVMTEAVLTILPVSFADKKGLLLTFRDTSEHRSVKAELEDIRQQLNNILKISEQGIFRLTLKGKIELTQFNRKLSSLLGYDSENGLQNISLYDILAHRADLKKMLAELNDKKVIRNRLIELRKKDGTLFKGNLTLLLSESYQKDNVYCDGIINTVESNMILNDSDKINDSILTMIQLDEQPVMELCKKAVICSGNTKIRDIIQIMLLNSSDYILLEAGHIITGIITRHDLISRYFNKNLREDSVATEIMTSPVVQIDENAFVSEAAAVFEHNNISHLILREASGETKGVLRKDDLFGVFIDKREKIKRMIDMSITTSDFRLIRDKNISLIRPALKTAVSIMTLNRLMSDFNDLITIKIIENSIREVGQPPVAFSFISLGSSGRQELLFSSDQDNALIYNDSSEFSEEELQKYFIKLSDRICRKLDESGLLLCSGGYMASNPKWCQPLSKWKEYFNEWIVNAEPANILNITVFFDLRHIYGDINLFNRLEDYIFEILNGRTAFFYFLAQSAAGYKTPLNVFGNLNTESFAKKTDAIDIKNPVAQVVMFARIYALNSGVRHKGTINRIKSLLSKGILSYSTAEETIFHFEFLSRLRLKNQIAEHENNDDLSNYIVPKKLTEIEQMILKKVLSQMNGYSEKLSASFMSSYKQI